MSERILRLCKRVGKFSFEDIYTVAEDIEQSILEAELENNIKKIIQNLETEWSGHIVTKCSMILAAKQGLITELARIRCERLLAITTTKSIKM